MMEFMLEAVKVSKFIPVKQKIPSVKLASLLRGKINCIREKT